MAIGVGTLKWGVLPLIDIVHLSISLSILIFTGCFIYLTCLWLFDRNFVRETRVLIKKVVLA
jgi:hypothetical protein